MTARATAPTARAVGDRITLTDDEKRTLRYSDPAAGYVAVVRFRGPRGRRYRPVRTAARVDRPAVLDEVNAIRQRQYAHGAYPVQTIVYRVDWRGVIEEVA